MSLFLKLAYLFFIGSVLGWVIELLFRRFISSKNPERKWINPGFCVGPYVPLYGFGLSTMYVLAAYADSVVPDTVWGKVLMIVMMAAAMTLLEWIGGELLLKVSNVRLWDYSNKWGNINGLICPQFTLVWAACSAGYYFFVHPHILGAIQWLSENLAFSFVIGFFYGVFLIDVFFTFQLVSKIKKLADEYGIIVKYNAYKEKLDELGEKARSKSLFFLKSMLSPKEFFVKYKGTFTAKRVPHPLKKVKEKMRKN